MTEKNDANAYLQLPPNSEGRDLVAGHIGHRFLSQLQSISFDEQKDRLIYVGSSVFGGRSNISVFDGLLRKPWFHAVRGQDEEALLTLCTEKHIDYDNIPLGSSWIMRLSPSKIVDYAQKIRRLPLAIGIRSSEGSAGFIRERIPPDIEWGELREKLALGNKQLKEAMLYGRDLTRRKTDGVDRLFTAYSPNGPVVEIGSDVVSVGAGLIVDVKPMFDVVSFVDRVVPVDISPRNLSTSAQRGYQTKPALSAPLIAA